MGINFPNVPTVGQLYPQPPVTGQPVYKWDGEKWTVPIPSALTVSAMAVDVQVISTR